MAIKQPLINSEEQRAGLRRLTAKPVPVRIFLDRAMGRKRVRAMRVRADSPALVIAEAAEQAAVETAAVGVATAWVIAVCLQAPAPREAALVAAQAGGVVVRRARAVPAAVPAWAPEVVAAADDGDNSVWRG